MEITEDEYGSFYSGYISLSNGVNLIDQLHASGDEVLLMMQTLSEKDAEYKYEKGKWSLKEVFGHMTDTERIFCYRALAIARGEKNELPGYDHNLYVESAGFGSQTVESLILQYSAVRNATVRLFEGFSERDLLKRGVVNGSGSSVRAMGYVIAGHELHHLSIIAERYLPGLD